MRSIRFGDLVAVHPALQWVEARPGYQDPEWRAFWVCGCGEQGVVEDVREAKGAVAAHRKVGGCRVAAHVGRFGVTHFLLES